MKGKAPIGLEMTRKPALSTLAVAVQLCLSSSLSTTFTTWSLFSVLCYYADMDGHRSSILAGFACYSERLDCGLGRGASTCLSSTDGHLGRFHLSSSSAPRDRLQSML
jgi:hypothetical protein